LSWKFRLDRNDFFLVLLVLVTYSVIIFSPHPADPDANIILQNLRSFTGVWDYLKNLFHFQTIDFQPVRDLTLSMDLFFVHYGIHTIVFQNALWWMGCLLIIRRILGLNFPEISREKICWLSAAFAVYPLFTSSVSWGMNRKHLLSFFFILLATRSWMIGTTFHRRSAIITYLLSILSQPITLLWPVFALMWSGLKEKRKLALLALIFITIAGMNLFYYRSSEIFQHVYPPKEMNFDPGETALALGHYVFQLVAPYLLSFRYDLSHWSVLVGLGLFVGLLYFFRKSARAQLPWLAFGLLPLAIVLRDPFTLSDAYLLCPELMLLILAVPKLIKVPRLSLLLIIWIPFTSIEASHWRSRLKLAQTSFERRPDCGGAFNYMRTSYDEFQKAPQEARTYVIEHECHRAMHVTPFLYQSMVELSANSYFHETDLPLEKRRALLKDLSHKHPQAQIAFLGFLVREQQWQEAKSEAEDFGQRWKEMPSTLRDNPIASKIVGPFCEKEKIEPCASMTSQGQ
jgi:hypothetical protein